MPWDPLASSLSTPSSSYQLHHHHLHHHHHHQSPLLMPSPVLTSIASSSLRSNPGSNYNRGPPQFSSLSSASSSSSSSSSPYYSSPRLMPSRYTSSTLPTISESFMVGASAMRKTPSSNYARYIMSPVPPSLLAATSATPRPFRNSYDYTHPGNVMVCHDYQPSSVHLPPTSTSGGLSLGSSAASYHDTISIPTSSSSTAGISTRIHPVVSPQLSMNIPSMSSSSSYSAPKEDPNSGIMSPVREGSPNNNNNNTNNNESSPAGMLQRKMTYGTIRRGRPVVRVLTSKLTPDTEAPATRVRPQASAIPSSLPFVLPGKKTPGQRLQEKWRINTRKSKKYKDMYTSRGYFQPTPATPVFSASPMKEEDDSGDEETEEEEEEDDDGDTGKRQEEEKKEEENALLELLIAEAETRTDLYEDELEYQPASPPDTGEQTSPPESKTPREKEEKEKANEEQEEETAEEFILSPAVLGRRKSSSHQIHHHPNVTKQGRKKSLENPETPSSPTSQAKEERILKSYRKTPSGKLSSLISEISEASSEAATTERKPSEPKEEPEPIIKESPSEIANRTSTRRQSVSRNKKTPVTKDIIWEIEKAPSSLIPAVIPEDEEEPGTTAAPQAPPVVPAWKQQLLKKKLEGAQPGKGIAAAVRTAGNKAANEKSVAERKMLWASNNPVEPTTTTPKPEVPENLIPIVNKTAVFQKAEEKEPINPALNLIPAKSATENKSMPQGNELKQITKTVSSTSDEKAPLKVIDEASKPAIFDKKNEVKSPQQETFLATQKSDETVNQKLTKQLEPVIEKSATEQPLNRLNKDEVLQHKKPNDECSKMPKQKDEDSIRHPEVKQKLQFQEADDLNKEKEAQKSSTESKSRANPDLAKKSSEVHEIKQKSLAVIGKSTGREITKQSEILTQKIDKEPNFQTKTDNITKKPTKEKSPCPLKSQAEAVIQKQPESKPLKQSEVIPEVLKKPEKEPCLQKKTNVVPIKPMKTETSSQPKPQAQILPQKQPKKEESSPPQRTEGVIGKSLTTEKKAEVENPEIKPEIVTRATESRIEKSKTQNNKDTSSVKGEEVEMKHQAPANKAPDQKRQDESSTSKKAQKNILTRCDQKEEHIIQVAEVAPEKQTLSQSKNATEPLSKSAHKLTSSSKMSPKLPNSVTSKAQNSESVVPTDTKIKEAQKILDSTSGPAEGQQDSLRKPEAKSSSSVYSWKAASRKSTSSASSRTTMSDDDDEEDEEETSSEAETTTEEEGSVDISRTIKTKEEEFLQRGIAVPMPAPRRPKFRKYSSEDFVFLKIINQFDKRNVQNNPSISIPVFGRPFLAPSLTLVEYLKPVDQN
ncbi:unnamed protein product [Notodromas monacha]|uniref:Uncharacterized protein n=1 Tax=Notodromas monacha TaxID=399045 RepID=A0A7R9BK37_9CRUS|nr:unnamed protein product [Notodromas monacha]CAG0916945.1 unnamed protein product [Notodromas monacha]